MKHTAYSTYRSPAWKWFKSVFPDRTERDYCVFARRIWRAAIENSIAKEGPEKAISSMVWDRDSAYVDNVLSFLWKFRPITHYFLAPGVADFCESSVKEFSEDYCKRLPACPLVNAPPQDDSTWFAAEVFEDKGKMQGAFAVHFPAKERQRSLMVIPDCIVPIGVNRALKYYFCASDGEDTLLMQCQKGLNRLDGNGADSDTLWIARLVFGLSLYMDAFPETVVHAGNDDVQHIRHYDGPRNIVARNDVVDEEHRHGVSPHWRRGHFRLLASARFVHKRGQTVYVRGTFVKGQAFDVLEDAPSVMGVAARDMAEEVCPACAI